MIHLTRPTVPPRNDHYSHFKFVLFCEIMESEDGHTDVLHV